MALTSSQQVNFLSGQVTTMVPFPDGSISSIDKATYLNWLFVTVLSPGPTPIFFASGGVIIETDAGVKISITGGNTFNPITGTTFRQSGGSIITGF
jgi:hypothetical protein